ncbi:hypothetical protein GCM10007368_22830 [Isoptericola cucumis]|uniref:Uncharacterized protein n=1 Tax=Isoptericola cucumis TaxID=1776856 RepID=A0ABQ2B5V5_9MICO|nr:hypothetical protein GCM10007368_22830 [Isoptericola cucumis]
MRRERRDAEEPHLASARVGTTVGAGLFGQDGGRCRGAGLHGVCNRDGTPGIPGGRPAGRGPAWCRSAAGQLASAQENRRR